jgi:hypothetical protein
MTASYNFICVPIDTRNPENAKSDFALRIVSEIRFETGVSHSPSAISEALNRHPLLRQPAVSPVKVLIWDFASWSANSHSMNPGLAIKAAIQYSGSIPVDRLLTNLHNYLGTSTEAVVTAKLGHAARHELLKNDHFVDVNKAADHLRSVAHSLRLSALRSVDAANALRAQSSTRGPQTSSANENVSQLNLEKASFRLAKWLDAAMHSSLLELFHETVPAERERLFRVFDSHASQLQSVSDAVDKIVRRLKVDNPPSCPLNETKHLSAVGATGETQKVEMGDPNVAVHSAIKNSLMAESCGFVTRWSIQCPEPIYGKRDYVIQLDTSSLVYDNTKIEVQQATPTAFRRAGHTHPVSYVDIGSTDTQNCLLAYLNDKSDQPRYRASCVNAEAGLVKQTILQMKNSLGGPAPNAEDNFGQFDLPLDERPPQVLKHEQFGTPEPETSGVVFSAPADDLMVPTGLRFPSDEKRRAAMPCLFLEDLWVGFRLDLKGEKQEHFTSTHLQEQEVTLVQSGETLSGWTEDYVEREQLDDPSLEHSSTDLTAYNGLSAGQMKDYQKLLGVDRPAVVDPKQLFRAITKAYGKTERLVFQNLYNYRYRLVLLGGISCDCSDRELDSDRFSAAYRQQFPFFRARALRAGEVLISVPDRLQENDKNGRTIYLTSEHPHAVVTLVPSPIDLDTSRFSGMLFVTKEEPKTLQGRKHVSDLGKFFTEVPPSDLNYFYDPDVFGVVIRTKMLNGDERSEPEDLVYSDGTYCRIARHLELDAVTEKYGEEGDWKQFKPIVISFRTSTNPKPDISRKGWWGHCRHIEVRVPRAAELQLSLVPLFDPNLLKKTASYIASSAELLEHGSAVPGAEAFLLPAVAEETIKVVHAVDAPREIPSLYCTDPRLTPNATAGEMVCAAQRDLDSQFTTFVGRVEADAASTKEIRLEASWMDINDAPNQGKYFLESGTATMPPRSIVFREFEAVRPSAANFHKLFLSGSVGQPSVELVNYRVEASQYGFTDQFKLQCVENKVFFGREDENGSSTTKSTSNRFDGKDQRRKLAKLEAVAVGRFADRFSANSRPAELRSNPVVVDVPSTIRMSAPKISHVVPLRCAATVGNKESGVKRSLFGLRVYVRKPFFESGIGERLGVGCFAGTDKAGSDNTELQKYVTQWGEDPIERASLSLSLRVPRAADFGAPTEDGDVDGAQFDAVLYPPNVRGGQAAVIYRDNLELVAPGPKAGKRWLSVASYALRYDERQRLWFADIKILGDFFGWCGMALYRHQPGALPERELSDTSAWVYAAVLYGEPVAWVEKNGNLHITIGPVYDPNVTFELDSLRYRDGISQNLMGLQRENQVLHSYVVGKATYFEVVIASKNFEWSLFKKRFGYAVAASILRQ